MVPARALLDVIANPNVENIAATTDRPAVSVYVDDGFVAGDWGFWSGGGHMQADTLEELHAMADRLGLRRSWFQSKPGKPWRDHYDLTATNRNQAVRLGAIPVTWREAGRRNRKARLAHAAAGGPQDGAGGRPGPRVRSRPGA
jgi:hypothetical protein